jgi:hypothetical protein
MKNAAITIFKEANVAAVKLLIGITGKSNF